MRSPPGRRGRTPGERAGVVRRRKAGRAASAVLRSRSAPGRGRGGGGCGRSAARAGEGRGAGGVEPSTG
ncbi:hypothetical protein DEH18_31935 [Streptomyces sp. NHF165]|nr:hypothetical protein DEH18_31935 [Streptomyces sp. NHF165]